MKTNSLNILIGNSSYGLFSGSSDRQSAISRMKYQHIRLCINQHENVFKMFEMEKASYKIITTVRVLC